MAKNGAGTSSHKQGNHEGLPLRVAVASNFSPTAHKIVTSFEAGTNAKVSISSASSGKLYAQIKQGAPFDVFLSADAIRPDLLVKEGYAVAASNRVYAHGRLVFWVPGVSGNESTCRQLLYSGQLTRVAMANPDVAPYGYATRQTLTALGLKNPVFTLIFGENIGQTFAFIHAGGVAAGFIAASQWQLSNRSGCAWEVGTQYHAPIAQRAVLLNRASNNALARRFLDFLHSSKTQAKIKASGYLLGDQ